ncbi:MAG: HDOD domain-containing protein [Desulfobulbus sp.]|nr:HDOD domain-containing protein [Desulfobulbus sp.]
MNVYIARQPIFDNRKRLYAYEILYRSGTVNTFPKQVDGNEATHAVLGHVLFNIGLDAITGSYPALINFTEDHLLSRSPLQLPKERCIIEILESVRPTPPVIEACQELNDSGYLLALDDFDFNSEIEPFIPLTHLIKVDFKSVDQTLLADRIARMQQSAQSVTWLAEKIETEEEFQVALSLGFDYFQGYFFDKPQILKRKTIDASKIILLNLLGEVCRPEINLRKLEELITPNVSLSYKLLRYINSAYYSLIRKVESVRYALVYLGEYGVRQFISMAAASEIARDKPTELMRLSMVRAQQCQLLAIACGQTGDASQLYLLGLFSLLDSMLDVPMAELTAKLPLSNELILALTEQKGRFAPYLQAVVANERGNFDTCTEHLATLGISPVVMSSTYLQALAWADSFEANLV